MNTEELQKQKEKLEKELTLINQKLKTDPNFLKRFLELVTRLGFTKQVESDKDEYELISEDESIICDLEVDFKRDVFSFSFTDYETGEHIQEIRLTSKEKVLEYLSTPISFTNFVTIVEEKYYEWETEEEFQNTLKVKLDDNEKIEVVKTVTFFKESTSSV